MIKQRWFLLLIVLLSLGLSACNRPAEETDQDQPRAEGDSEVISEEADWARRIASLRVDDAGTNNGRTRIAVLEVLYAMRGRLETQSNTPEFRRDLDVIQDTVERMYSSANLGAQGEWQLLSRDFVALENNLENPEQARRFLDQIIIRIGG